MIFFIDMDGVLVRYERHAYRGSDPKWKRQGYHYYRNAPADSSAIELLRMLNSYYPTYILSKVKEGPLYREHCEDKYNWLVDNIPFMRRDRVIFTPLSKENCIRELWGVSLIPHDFALIDDYNNNLKAWREAGGLSIKYISKVNTASSWDGYYVRSSLIRDDMQRIFNTIANRRMF